MIGLGYVGLPLAVALAKSFDVLGLDIDARRIAELESGHDRTHELDAQALAGSTLRYTSERQQANKNCCGDQILPHKEDNRIRPVDYSQNLICLSDAASLR